PFSVSAYSWYALPSAGTCSRMPSATSFRSRTVRMFLATPRLLWNSPNRRFPANASRTTSIDQVSPAASSDRATGQASFSKLLCFMALTPLPGRVEGKISLRLQDAATPSTIPGQLQVATTTRSKSHDRLHPGPHRPDRHPAEGPVADAAPPGRGPPFEAPAATPEGGGGPGLRRGGAVVP